MVPVGLTPIHPSIFPSSEHHPRDQTTGPFQRTMASNCDIPRGDNDKWPGIDHFQAGYVLTNGEIIDYWSNWSVDSVNFILIPGCHPFICHCTCRCVHTRSSRAAGPHPVPEQTGHRHVDLGWTGGSQTLVADALPSSHSSRGGASRFPNVLGFV